MEIEISRQFLRSRLSKRQREIFWSRRRNVDLRMCRGVHSRRLLGSLALLAWMAASTTFALQAQPIAPEYEPPSEQAFQTETLETQDKGQVTFVWGGSFSRSDSHYASEHPVTMDYGITDHWQIRFEVGPSMRRDPETGALARTTGDWLVGTKRDFLNLGGTDIHLAAGFNFAAPSDTNNPMSSGVRAYNPYLVLAKDLPGSSRVFTHMGVDLLQNVQESEEAAAHVLNWSSGYYFPVREFLLLSEFSLSTDRWNHAGQTREMYVTPGVFRRLSDRWWVGVGVPVGLNADSTKLGVTLALIYEFNVFPTLN